MRLVRMGEVPPMKRSTVRKERGWPEHKTPNCEDPTGPYAVTLLQRQRHDVDTYTVSPSFPPLNTGQNCQDIWPAQKHTVCLRARRILSPQRQEILGPLDRLAHFSQKFLQVFISIDEIDF